MLNFISNEKFWISVLVILTILNYVVLPIAKMIAKKTSNTVDDRVVGYIETAIDLVEKYGLGSTSESKLQRAKDLVNDKLDKVGLKPIADELLTKEIEKAITNKKLVEAIATEKAKEIVSNTVKNVEAPKEDNKTVEDDTENKETETSDEEKK